MRELLEKMMNRYGISLSVTIGKETWNIRGIFQPVFSKSRQSKERSYSALGTAPKGQYLLIAPAEPTMFMGCGLAAKGKRYRLRRVDTVYHQDKPVYQWCLCEETEG